MNGTVLKGLKGNYLYFPDDNNTILSAGKFAFVYLGLDVATKQKRIIKRLNPNIEENQLAALRFMLEASIQVEHPAIIKPVDLIVQNNSRYLILEFINGLDLKQLIRENTITGNHHLIANITLKLLDALDAIHEKQIFHRNIKPSNVLIAFNQGTEKINWNNPQVHIIDFGLAKTPDNIPVYVDERRINPFSMLYSPPEVLLHKEVLVDHRSDMYNIGIMMMEMFTGQPAFYAENPAKLIDLQINGKLSQPSNMYNRFFEITQKASGKIPFRTSPKNLANANLLQHLADGMNTRYLTTTEMKTDILEFLKHPGEKPAKGFKAIKKVFGKK